MNVALRRLRALGLVRLEKRGLTVLDLCGLRNYKASCDDKGLGAGDRPIRCA